MTSIPQHIRDNFEETDNRLHQMHGMLVAVEHMAEAVNPPVSTESEALFVLLQALRLKLAETNKAHMTEWAGLGGSTETLTETEIAAARGKAGEGVQ
jgi:hypothetical protein